MPRFEAGNAVVLGISNDRTGQLKAWHSRLQLNFDLLSDPKQRVIRAWEAGVSLLGVAKIPLTRRSCWVIDERGILIDLQVGIGPKESVARALRALNADAAT